MEEIGKKKWPFRIQFITIALLPLIIVTINIPNSAVNEYFSLKVLYDIGMVSIGIVLFGAFPIGMVGYLNARKEAVLPRLEMPTKVLGVINCIIGAMFVGIVLMIIFFGFVVGV